MNKDCRRVCLEKVKENITVLVADYLIISCPLSTFLCAPHPRPTSVNENDYAARKRGGHTNNQRSNRPIEQYRSCRSLLDRGPICGNAAARRLSDTRFRVPIDIFPIVQFARLRNSD
jgi:hypothetical protein